MENTLVTIFDGGGVMKDLDVSVKILDTEILVLVLALLPLHEWVDKA